MKGAEEHTHIEPDLAVEHPQSDALLRIGNSVLPGNQRHEMLALSGLDVRQDGGVREKSSRLLEGLERPEEGRDIVVDIPLDQVPHGPNSLDVRGLESDEGLAALDIVLGQGQPGRARGSPFSHGAPSPARNETLSSRSETRVAPPLSGTLSRPATSFSSPLQHSLGAGLWLTAWDARGGRCRAGMPSKIQESGASRPSIPTPIIKRSAPTTLS